MKSDLPGSIDFDIALEPSHRLEISPMSHWISMPQDRNRRNPTGFTLIELLVVIAIIAVLIALLLPAVQQAREAARRTQCKNNLMQIGLALQNYMGAHQMLPPGTQNKTGPIKSQEDGGYHMGWMAQILPYIEQQNVYDHIDFTKSVYDPINIPVRQQRPKVFICPTDPSPNMSLTAGMTSYCGIHNDFETPIDVNQNGVLFLNSSIRYDQIRDGSSNTLFVIESRLNDGGDLGWMSGTRSSLRNAVIAVGNIAAPTDGSPPPKPSFRMHLSTSSLNGMTPAQLSNVTTTGPDFVGGGSSYHAGGLQVAMGDGSVRFISQTIDAVTLRNLAHRADGEMMKDF